MTNATISCLGGSLFTNGMEVEIIGTSGRSLPKWVTRWPFQDGDRMLVRWFCRKVLGWKLNLNGRFRVVRVVNRNTLEIA